jgi:hypothetical protein
MSEISGTLKKMEKLMTNPKVFAREHNVVDEAESSMT